MKQICLLGYILCLLSCAGTQDKEFKQFKKTFIELRKEQFPKWASYKGDNNYHHVLSIPNKSKYESDLSFYTTQLNKANEFREDKLDSLNQLSLNDIKQFLNKRIKDINTNKQYEWDPSYYNVAGELKWLLASNYAPLPTRLKAISQKLDKTDLYYEAAKSNLQQVSIKSTLLAIDKHIKGFQFLNGELRDSLKSVTITPIEKKELEVNIQKAKYAIKDYLAFCESLKFEYEDKDSQMTFRDE